MDKQNLAVCSEAKLQLGCEESSITLAPCFLRPVKRINTLDVVFDPLLVIESLR
jgi:alpha-D-ribose 1-methylphosphonate 5-triphosphate synthase subunit PhnL